MAASPVNTQSIPIASWLAQPKQICHSPTAISSPQVSQAIFPQPTAISSQIPNAIFPLPTAISPQLRGPIPQCLPPSGFPPGFDKFRAAAGMYINKQIIQNAN